MPDEFDNFLSEQQQLDFKRQQLIEELKKQKEAAIKAFDEKLARLGYRDGTAPKRSRPKRKSEKPART